MTSTFYLVRAENRREPESYVCGLYVTETEAQERVDSLKEEYDFAWFDDIQVGDLDLCNR